jgi:hypothetical protein
LQHKNEDLSKESKFPGSIDDADRIRIWPQSATNKSLLI